LLYQKFLFSLDIPVQPAVVRVHIPGLALSPSKLGTSVVAVWLVCRAGSCLRLQELMWLFFCPAWVYDIEFLPVLVLARPLDRS
jgi:hypothetical protein